MCRNQCRSRRPRSQEGGRDSRRCCTSSSSREEGCTLCARTTDWDRGLPLPQRAKEGGWFSLCKLQAECADYRVVSTHFTQDSPRWKHSHEHYLDNIFLSILSVPYRIIVTVIILYQYQTCGFPKVACLKKFEIHYITLYIYIYIYIYIIYIYIYVYEYIYVNTFTYIYISINIHIYIYIYIFIYIYTYVCIYIYIHISIYIYIYIYIYLYKYIYI